MQTRSRTKREAAAAHLPEAPTKSKRAKRGPLQPVKADWDVLPHNLGRVSAAKTGLQTQAPAQDDPGPVAAGSQDQDNGEDLDKEGRSIGDAVEGEAEDISPKGTVVKGKKPGPKQASKRAPRAAKKAVEGDAEVPAEKPKRVPKKTPDNPYGLTPGRTPFPDWNGPSAEACEEVYRILADLHGECKQPEKIPAPSLEVTGCGEVPSVLDALMRTLLSGATTMANSNTAFQGLVQKYGTKQEGIGQGSVDWNSVRLSTEAEVIEAIKRGGLAKVKGKHIKAILDMVHAENVARRNAYLEEKVTGIAAGVVGAESKTQGQKDLEIFKTEHDILSLDHMHGMAPDKVMMELTKYPGIGVKTVACVILFCLRQPSFAVDTHVWRMCKWLKWVPPRADPNDTFSHCEVKVPDHLKYPLHQLFIYHGKGCAKCRAITSEGTEGWEKADCPLEHLLERVGKRRAAAPNRKKIGKKAKGEVQDEVKDEASDEEEASGEKEDKDERWDNNVEEDSSDEEVKKEPAP